MAAHAGRTAHTLHWPEPASTAKYPPPRVLLIDEHADTRELYELWLTQRAFAVAATATGSAALAAARAQAPHVIVVELMVPDGGVPLIRALRAEAGCRDAIIIVLTTQAEASVRDDAIQAGADSYLVKPCGVVRLGEAMAAAGRDRSRFVPRDAGGAKPPSARIELALQLSQAIRERLASNGPAWSAATRTLH